MKIVVSLFVYLLAGWIAWCGLLLVVISFSHGITGPGPDWKDALVGLLGTTEILCAVGMILSYKVLVDR